jgi:nitrogen regulatory protein PII
MKMLMMIFRASLEGEVLELLEELGVKAFTELQRVGGAGETGSALDSYDWPGVNTMIFAAMVEDQADRVVQRFKAYRDQRVQEQEGLKLPFRVFVLPCLQVV